MNRKIKPMLPSLREKKRYLVFEVISKHKIDSSKDVKEAIINSCKMLLGELGLAKAGIIFLEDKYNKETNRGILRVNNKHVDEVKAALTFIEKINNKEVIVKSVGLSGILKKTENKYLKPILSEVK